MTEPRATARFLPGADTAEDLQNRARDLIPPEIFDHIVGGGGDERTVAANRLGFGRYKLRPRILVDVSDADTGVEILGTALAAPIFTCPTGGIRPAHPDAERAVARGAAAAGAGLILASSSSFLLEDVAAVAGPARWQQLYWQRNPRIMADLVRRAQAAGFRAIVLTVDNPMPASRRRLARSGYQTPAWMLSPNTERYATPVWQARLGDAPSAEMPLTWKSFEWLRTVVDIPLLLKGITTPEDAVLAVESGADGIIVSNHGGRYLDAVAGTIDVLESVVEAVAGRIPVLLDGGVRSATDIAIALGLGAAAVGLGRPVVWAMACGGEETVGAYLGELAAELRRTLGLLGVTRVSGLTRGHVSRADPGASDAALLPFLPPR